MVKLINVSYYVPNVIANQSNANFSVVPSEFQKSETNIEHERRENEREKRK